MHSRPRTAQCANQTQPSLPSGHGYAPSKPFLFNVYLLTYTRKKSVGVSVVLAWFWCGAFAGVVLVSTKPTYNSSPTAGCCVLYPPKNPGTLHLPPARRVTTYDHCIHLAKTLWRRAAQILQIVASGTSCGPDCGVLDIKPDAAAAYKTKGHPCTCDVVGLRPLFWTVNLGWFLI